MRMVRGRNLELDPPALFHPDWGRIELIFLRGHFNDLDISIRSGRLILSSGNGAACQKNHGKQEQKGRKKIFHHLPKLPEVYLAKSQRVVTAA